jgi:hypothetical protein
MSEDFEVIGSIDEIQLIARGKQIRELARLRVRGRTLAQAEGYCPRPVSRWYNSSR